MIGRFCRNYLQRHQNRANQLLHLLGVPLTFGVSTACLVNSNGAAAVGCFLGGYALQFLGHAIEGNDAGEIILIKKVLNKPYIEFAPGSDYSNFND